jgi:hypothetical protein
MNTTERTEQPDLDVEQLEQTAERTDNEPVPHAVTAIAAETEKRLQTHVRDAGGFGGWRVW